MERSVYVTIGEAAAAVGVHPATLRGWERAGVIPAAMRRRGMRVYTAADLAEIERAVLVAPARREVASGHA